MALVSIRLPDDVDAGLAAEAKRLGRPKSEIVRDAIADYLKRQARERFLSDIARAARARGDTEALDLAAEALPLDNEALEQFGDAVAREPGVRHVAVRTRKKR